MSSTLIKNAIVVNEGISKACDVLVKGDRIEKIAENISAENATVMDAKGLHLMPGMIDAHVHFREPGFTEKGDIHSESRAAVAGGITSFMDMPNTSPFTVSIDELEKKFSLASNKAFANYSFYLGITHDNYDEIMRVDNAKVCGITDDGLYMNGSDFCLANNAVLMEKVFQNTSSLVALHCENFGRIKENESVFTKDENGDLPIGYHAIIRSDIACYEATRDAVNAAKKWNTRLHVLHVSAGLETDLFENSKAIGEKRITAETCVQYLYFTNDDTKTLGAKIKWNPAIKRNCDRSSLIEALRDGRLDSIATDHAPHLWSQKQGGALLAKSGGPMVQHALPVLFELFQQRKLTLEQIVSKTSHNVADMFNIVDRGYIREGYFADLVLFNPNFYYPKEIISQYKCGWSPFDHQSFHGYIDSTMVNGQMVYRQGQFLSPPAGKRLEFKSNR